MIHINMSIDMSAYCIALREYVAASQHAGDVLQQLDYSIEAIMHEVNEPILQQFDKRKREIYDQVLVEKRKLQEMVRGFPGAMQGSALIASLKAKLALADPQEQALAKQLDTTEKPLVFECVESCFVEILKNSMDAIIDKGVRTGLRVNMELKLNVQVELLPDAFVAMTFRDNGTGFPDEFLSQFQSFIKDKKYLSDVHATHKNTSSFYFGGRGRGMGMICAKLLDGIEIGPTIHTPLYEPSACAKNRIFVSNENGGAMIKLMSSIHPVKRMIDLLSPDEELTDDAKSTMGRSLCTSDALYSPGASMASPMNTPLHQQGIFSVSRRPVMQLNVAALQAANFS